MARYIDADAILEDKLPNAYISRFEIDCAPTADVAPVEYAEWIGVFPDADTRQCSKCGYNVPSDELVTPYCPWCGRRMNVKVVIDKQEG